MDDRPRRLLIDSLLLGAVGALAAQAFTFLLKVCQEIFLGWMAGYRPPGLPHEGGVLQQVVGPHGMWLVPVATTLGGLLSGILVYRWAPEAEGHGTDTAVKSFHELGGFIRPRVAPLKAIASAITIGSGGSAGREGPIALTSAAIGSIYASLSRCSQKERRLLVLIGMAAGLSAIFRSPIGTAVFAIEVLYGSMEFESRGLIYTLLSSIVAYALNGLFVGWEPLFHVPNRIAPAGFAGIAWFGVLGGLSGIVATLLPVAFYGVRDAFRSIPLRPHFKPALGGLGVGLVALAVPQILGGGYGWIQEAIDGALPVRLLLLLVFAKMLAFALTVSSGGSGGVFAPSLYVGAMLGGFLAQTVQEPSAPFVIIGMAAVFGAAARVPIATLLMVTEMTGGYSLLVPAAFAVILSYLVQLTLASRLKYRSLYEGQVPTLADSPAHQIDHLRTAFSLLDKNRARLSERVGHVNLLALLRSGVPVDLPENNRLIIGRLKAESSFAGMKVGSTGLPGAGSESQIVAILRDGHLLLPLSETVLQSEDQLIVLTSTSLSEAFTEHLDPLEAGPRPLT